MDNSKIIFNRNLIKTRRNRVAKNFYRYNFLYYDFAKKILERINDLNLIRTNTTTILDLGSHTGLLGDLIKEEGAGEKIFYSDISEAMLKDLSSQNKVVSDEEFLPFKNNSFNLVVSNLTLHWVNDLVSVLKQIRNILKPGGLLIASIFGGDTLWELRNSMILAETEFTSKSYPRVSPFIETKVLGNLLRYAGFKMVVTDVEKVSVTYRDLFALIEDLRGMGENGALLEEKQFLNKKVFEKASDIYKKKFSNDYNDISATFEILTMTGNV